MTPNERKLNHALRMLADAGPTEAPAAVEQALLAAFRRRQSKRKMMWWSAGSVAAAIAAGVAVFMFMRPASPVVVTSPNIYAQAQARGTTVPQQRVVVAALARRAHKRRRPRPETAEFYALPDADNVVPLEHATVVRVQMPMSDLRDLGLPVNEQRAGDRVRADLLLGEDGVARAVRFLQ